MALLAILAIPLHAQRLVIGERVPDLNITQWLNGAPVSDGKAVMVEFYHSSNPKGAERLAQLDELAKSYGDRLAVIVVTREKDDAVIRLRRNRTAGLITQGQAVTGHYLNANSRRTNIGGRSA